MGVSQSDSFFDSTYHMFIYASLFVTLSDFLL